MMSLMPCRINSAPAKTTILHTWLPRWQCTVRAGLPHGVLESCWCARWEIPGVKGAQRGWPGGGRRFGKPRGLVLK